MDNAALDLNPAVTTSQSRAAFTRFYGFAVAIFLLAMLGASLVR